ncbi:MAG: AAA family ATPase [Acidimicrobiales bacterium]
MRVSIVGSSGSGKTTLAKRIVERTGIHHIELDALHHLEGWVQQERALMRAQVAKELEHPDWVCDGNYESMVGDLVRAAPDTILVFDLPRVRVVRQVAWRTVKRAVRREELWNGNREPLSNFTRWDPEHNVIRWSWVNHEKYQKRFQQAMETGEWDHAEVVRLTSHADADRWLASLQETAQ